MDIASLPNHPLSMDDVQELQESILCTPLFFLPETDSREDIILIATTKDSVHTHIAFDPDTEQWVEIGDVEVGDSLGESNAMAFGLFSEDADWLDERYDRDDIAIIDDPSSLE